MARVGDDGFQREGGEGVAAGDLDHHLVDGLAESARGGEGVEEAFFGRGERHADAGVDFADDGHVRGGVSGLAHKDLGLVGLVAELGGDVVFDVPDAEAGD